MTNDSTGDGVGQVIWLFEADNVLRQSLGAGQVLVQTYTVVIDDGHGGTASQLVTITINGTNDAAVITGDTTGAVVEAGGVANAIPGHPDRRRQPRRHRRGRPPDSWTVVGTPTASTNGYGSFTITAAGVWSYTLDNTNPTVQAVPAGGTLDRQLHGRHHRRHRAGRHHHHHRGQRRTGGGGRQQRRRCGDRERRWVPFAATRRRPATC